HAAHHQELLIVFLAKYRKSATCRSEDTGKQLHHHGADAGKESGAKLAFENVRDLRIRQNLEHLWLRVEIKFARREQHVATCRFQLCTICLPGTRIAIEILMGQELQPIDENARNRDVPKLGCGA